MIIIKTITIIILGIIIASCSQIQTTLDKTKNYKLDISIVNKEYSAIGMLVLPKKPLYTIFFEAESRISFISFRTCSREVTAEDPSVGVNHKKYSINYAPNEIEAEGNCPTVISAFGDKGMYSVGMIDYEDPHATLPAENICGSYTEKTNGVSVCQERVSSMERIRFAAEVLASPDLGCELESGNRGVEFSYKIKSGYCTYAFMETKAPFRIHRLTTYGYDDIIITR